MVLISWLPSSLRAAASAEVFSHSKVSVLVTCCVLGFGSDALDELNSGCRAGPGRGAPALELQEDGLPECSGRHDREGLGNPSRSSSLADAGREKRLLMVCVVGVVGLF